VTAASTFGAILSTSPRLRLRRADRERAIQCDPLQRRVSSVKSGNSLASATAAIIAS